MDHRKYRIVIRFDQEKECFIGNVPELPECEVEGDDWETVTAGLSEAIEAKLETIEHKPTPIDEVEFEGKLELDISKSLMRELMFMAKTDEIEPQVLAQELIAEGLGRRYGGHRFYRSGGQRRPQNQNSRQGNRQGGGYHRGMNQEQYHNIMEDKASFLEYVRGLDDGNNRNR
ncbi:type II toxin-antitoxin system HicB family antitoxin [Myxococcota bacterium]|nr:type II toxin-antitoxin system HicB family antitoxin [Myxococcota bacterium]